MCSIDENDTSLMPQEEKILIDSNTECPRCKKNIACLVLQKKHAYCRDCFLTFVTHKFRAALGKSKLMKPKDRVLVAYSGSPSSVMLLHMLWSGLQEEDHKKLLYKIVFCYIEDGLLTGQSLEERKRNINEHKAYVESFGFEFYFSTLGQLFADGDVLIDEPSEISTHDEKLQQLFESCPSLTSKQDLRWKLLHNLLVSITKTLECNKLFTAEVQTKLAVKLLTSIALGRGEQLASETSFTDSRYSDLMILRPLLDIDEKEVFFYNDFHGLVAKPRVTLASLHPGPTSITNLTASFINGLQEEFPSTVPTVFRTGEKLSNAKRDIISAENQCLLCHESLSTKEGGYSYSAMQATAYSRIVSKDSGESNSSCCGNCSCADKSATYDEKQLALCFCYGCLNIIREMKSLDHLPPNIYKQIPSRISLQSMRSQIADFLIDG